tara:strand:- start:1738 stop:2988 length:1251 start_codon:yes stop_codon:yes gene_type:complete
MTGDPMTPSNLQKKPQNPYQVIFSNGFRPLFLCAGAFALVALGWWAGYLKGWLSAPTSHLNPVYWHGHEMLFGLVGAAIGGFLLAAVANWTGRSPVQGTPLTLLVGSWLLGRGVMLSNGALPELLVLGVDSLYWVLLTALVGREIWISGNRRNLKVIVILGLFGFFNLLFHAQSLVDSASLNLRELGIRGALMLICLMITLIGGRIIPAFTRNWLKLNRPQVVQLPPEFNRWDAAAAGATLIMALSWILAPAAAMTAVLAILAGTLQLIRLARWCGLKVVTEPLLFALHLGYGWLGLGFILLGLSTLVTAITPSAGVHALALGAMAGLILPVAARAALGHTNRVVSAGPLMSCVFVLIHLAALLRVLATLPSLWSGELLSAAALCWLAAFGLFCVRYVPVLLLPAAPTLHSPLRSR